MATSTEITDLINAFTVQIAGVIEAAATDRVRSVVAGVLGAQTRRPPGRPRKAGADTPLGAQSAAKRRPSATASATVPAGATTPKSKARPSWKAARARRLQGRYLGLLRTLKGEARTRVKVAAREKGVAEALKLGRALKG